MHEKRHKIEGFWGRGRVAIFKLQAEGTSVQTSSGRSMPAAFEGQLWSPVCGSKAHDEGVQQGG